MTRLPLRCKIGGAAVLLWLASVLAAWPGVAMYDTIAQYKQVSSGVYDDWHPPAMARIWTLLAPFGPGAVPMLVLQLATYWAGLGLLSGALATNGRRRGAAAVLAIGLLPPFLGWQMTVLKDAQLTGALLAAIGLVGWSRLRGMRVPVPVSVVVGMVVAYAVLVRANAVFAAVPLVVMLLPWPKRPVPKIGVALVAIVGVLAVAPAINHHLLQAQSSGVERTQALYDLAGIAVRVPNGGHIGLTADEARAVNARHCAKAFFWDPLGDDAHCGAVMARLRRQPVGALYAMLALSAVHHPLAYAGHRLAHLNSTERWLVPVAWPNAAPPAISEPNTVGLGTPGRVARGWQAVAGWVVETPLGWPIAWLVVAMTAVAVSNARPRTPAGILADALLASAICLEGSFVVLSIASDLRYHLWAMIATALAVVLLADRPVPRRILWIGGAALAIVVVGGTAARIVLPRAPVTYAAMLD